MPSVAEKRAVFRKLHESGCFVIPNPWDVGSAKLLESLGFKALATTSSGFAWSRGRADNHLSRDVVLAHLRELAAATDLPLNADFEKGFADDPAGVEESVRLAVDTGVAGLSIEDSTGNREEPLFPLDVAVERMRAARRAIDASGGDTLLVGRAECFIAGIPDLDETIRRLKAYSEAGADCLYAPGLRTAEQVRAVVEAVAPKPVNVLVGSAGGFSVADLAALGVRRISVGGGLARVGWMAVANAAKQLAEEGSFAGFTSGPPAVDLNRLFSEDAASREGTPQR
jgi:2-methylisocitrate lyase-like PEP mutase family enzyme